MKKMTLLLLFVVSCVGVVQAGQFKKSYFSATKPGSWAKYEMVSNDGSQSDYTYKRLADSEGRVVYELTNHVSEGSAKGVTAVTLYVLEPGFDLDRNFLNYAKAMETMISQNDGGEPNVTTPEVVKIIRDSSIDFSKGLDFVKKEKIDKYQCDYYTYNIKTSGPRPMTHVGKIWLDEKTPFGVVKQSAVIKDESKVLSEYTLRLLEFGSGAEGVPALLAKIPGAKKAAVRKKTEKPSAQTYTLAEAYEKEKLRLIVEVKEGSGGKRLSMIIKNKSKDSFMLTLPEGRLTLEAGLPVHTLNIKIDSENSIKLQPGQSAPPIEVGQIGKRGAIKGSFDLTMYKGEALYMGSVTIGTIK